MAAMFASRRFLAPTVPLEKMDSFPNKQEHNNYVRASLMATWNGQFSGDVTLDAPTLRFFRFIRLFVCGDSRVKMTFEMSKSHSERQIRAALAQTWLTHSAAAKTLNCFHKREYYVGILVYGSI